MKSLFSLGSKPNLGTMMHMASPRTLGFASQVPFYLDLQVQTVMSILINPTRSQPPQIFYKSNGHHLIMVSPLAMPLNLFVLSCIVTASGYR